MDFSIVTAVATLSTDSNFCIILRLQGNYIQFGPGVLVCLLNAGIKQSRSDFIFKHPCLRKIILMYHSSLLTLPQHMKLKVVD